MISMNIEFDDSRLALIETEAAADTRLPVAVIQSARQRLSIIRAAPDTRTLHSWKSLGLTNRSAPFEYLVVLSPQWAILVKILEKNNVMTVVVTSMKELLESGA